MKIKLMSSFDFLGELKCSYIVSLKLTIWQGLELGLVLEWL